MYGSCAYGSASYGAVSGTSKQSYKLTAEPGVFTLSGNDASLLAHRKLSAGAGIFSVTFNPAGLYRGYSLSAAPGVFTLTGNAVQFKIQRGLRAEPGVFSLSGSPLNFKRTYILTAQPGLFTLQGGWLYINKVMIKEKQKGFFGGECPAIRINGVDIALTYWLTNNDGPTEDSVIIQNDEIKDERNIFCNGQPHWEFSGFVNLYKYQDKDLIKAKFAEIYAYNEKVVSLLRHKDGFTMKDSASQAVPFYMEVYPKHLQTLDYHDLLFIRMRSLKGIEFNLGQYVIDDKPDYVVDDTGETFVLGGIRL
jgi:hypothetical protein